MTATATTGAGAGAGQPGATDPVASGPLIRVTLQGPADRPDLVLPGGVTPRVLLAEFAPDAPAGASLVGATGTVLDPDRPLGAQGVGDGAVLVLVAPAEAPDSDAPPARHARRAAAAGMLPFELPLLPGALALAGLAAGAASSAEVLARVGVALGIVVAAALVALAPRSGRLPHGAEAFAPGFAAAAVVALLPRSEPGADLLVIVAAAVVAAQAAALTRMVATPSADAALLVWLWVGAIVAGLGAAVMAGDGSPRVVWALAAVLAVAATKLLPRFVVDVPDEQLLDTDRMAATTWSARDVVTRGLRLRVRPREVASTVETGRRLLDAAAIAAAAVAGGTSIALAIDPGSGWTRWFSFATGALVGIALLTCSRAFGGELPRIVLRAGGLVALLGAAGGLLATASTFALFATAAGAAVVAVAVIAAAMALGHGWRSVWWARLGDGAESFSVALAFPAAVLAAGTFHHFRQMLS